MAAENKVCWPPRGGRPQGWPVGVHVLAALVNGKLPTSSPGAQVDELLVLTEEVFS